MSTRAKKPAKSGATRALGTKEPKRTARVPLFTPEISTTAAAILGLIAVQPGSAYDLARRMKTSHHFIWPRAESKLYEEVKRLHQLGLVDAEHEAVGKRPRTVYRIRPLGTQALELWVKRASEPPSLSFETLVKIAYSDFGSIDDARAQVNAIREQALQWIELGRGLARMYLENRVELPQRAHTNVLVWRFLAEYASSLLVWADRADAALARWDGVAPSDNNAQVTREVFEDGLKRFEAVLAQARGRPSDKG
jgi:PadR family transcriptional regulator AphA